MLSQIKEERGYIYKKLSFEGNTNAKGKGQKKDKKGA
jgi:hypothetical protein